MVCRSDDLTCADAKAAIVGPGNPPFLFPARLADVDSTEPSEEVVVGHPEGAVVFRALVQQLRQSAGPHVTAIVIVCLGGEGEGGGGGG